MKIFVDVNGNICPQAEAIDDLWPCHVKVLQGLLRLKTQRQIASELNISPSTLGGYWRDIKLILHIENTAELGEWAMRNGLMQVHL